MQNRDILVPGTLMRHFKGMLYQIVAIATHSETREDYVVYQALYGEYKTFIRPLDMFLSEVDHEKYPEVTQKYRFEVYRPEVYRSEGNVTQSVKVSEQQQGASIQSQELQVHIQQADMKQANMQQLNIQQQEEEKDEVTYENAEHKALLEFLDAKTYKDKLEILDYIKDTIDSQMVNSMAMAMDLVLVTDTVEEQINEIKNCLMTHMRYEDGRLR